MIRNILHAKIIRVSNEEEAKTKLFGGLLRYEIRSWIVVLSSKKGLDQGASEKSQKSDCWGWPVAGGLRRMTEVETNAYSSNHAYSTPLREEGVE